MGTPEFSIPTLEMVYTKFNVKAVFTQPPKPANRGMKIKKSPVHLYSEKNNLQIFCPVKLNEKIIEDEIEKINPDLIIVVAYGLIIPAKILKIPKFGSINGHASLLPKWRGASPIQRSIEAGDKETGCTSMLMEKGLDTGPILFQKRLKINEHDDSIVIHDKLSKLTSVCLFDTIIKFVNGTIQPSIQDQTQASYANKLLKHEGLINWKLTAKEIYNKLRAFKAFPGTFTFLKCLKIKVIDGYVNKKIHEAPPGTILTIDNTIIVACGNKTSFSITQIQKPGKRQLDTKTFLKGFSIKEGDFFD